MSPRTKVNQAALSTGFSNQEYWSVLPFPSSGLSFTFGYVSVKQDLFMCEFPIFVLYEPLISFHSVVNFNVFFLILREYLCVYIF